MIIVRPSAKLRVVCMSDPALDEVPREAMVEYGVTRNADLLKLDELKQQPTVWECDPLKTEYEHLALGDADGRLTPFHAWGIFSTHVGKAEPLPFKLDFVTQHQERVIDDDMRKVIPLRDYMEVAEAIRQYASADGDTVPFSPPQSYSWMTERIQRRAIRAARVPTDETANETNSD